MDLQNVSLGATGDKIAVSGGTKPAAGETLPNNPPQTQDGAQTQTQNAQQTAQTANAAGAKLEPQNAQEAQQAQQKTNVYTSVVRSKEEILQLLSKILQSLKSGVSIEVADKNLSAASVEKLTAQMQSSAQNAQVFAQLAQEIISRADQGGGEFSAMSPQEKELLRAIVKEIENFIRNTSPASPIAAFLEKLPKNATVQDLLVWAANQIKNGNLPARELLATPQILLGNANLRQNPMTSLFNALISTLNANANTAATGKNTPQTQTQTAQNLAANITPNTNAATNAGGSAAVGTATPDVQNQAGNRHTSAQTPQTQTANAPQTQTQVQTPQSPQQANSPNTAQQTATAQTQINPQNTAQTSQAATANQMPATNQAPNIAANTPATSPSTVQTQTQTQGQNPQQVNSPNTAQQTATAQAQTNPQNTVQTNQAATVNQAPATNENATSTVAATPQNTPAQTPASPQQQANLQTPATQLAPQTPYLVQQTSENIRENIKDLIGQTQHEGTKNLLNEILRQIPQKDESVFAYAKIENPAPAQEQASQTRFIPLTLQTRFNGEFVAVMSKHFPELPKELLFDTANAVRTGEKPVTLSPTVLQNLENILNSMTSAPQNAQSDGSAYKVTPSLLLNLLQYLSAADKNETLSQTLRADFSAQKSMENISQQAKNLLGDLDFLEKNITQKAADKVDSNALHSQTAQTANVSGELAKAVEKLSGIENLLKNAEFIFKRENAIEYLLEKTGVLQGKSRENALTKGEETLKSALREISAQIKTAAQKLETLPNLQAQEKMSETVSKLREFSNSVNDLARKIDATSLLANKVDITAGRSEQTVIVPVQIGDAWISMELRINKDEKKEGKKGKKEAQQVEISVELAKGNSVSAKANLTLEKQLQINIDFTSDKMLEWFKAHYKEFYSSLEDVGTKSVSVSFNKKRDRKETRGVVSHAAKSNLDVTG